MRRSIPHLRAKPLPYIQKLLDPWVPAGALSQEDDGENSRDRIFSIRLTFWAFLCQVLNPGSPCREIVRQVMALFSLHDQGAIDYQTGGYCTARKRLPRERLDKILGQIAQKARTRSLKASYWRDHEVKVVDGSAVTMPDTPDNQKKYPQQKAQKPGCGFPIMKFVGLFSLSTGCLLSVVSGNYYQAELSLFRQLWHYLKPGDVLVADRGFADYGTLAGLWVNCVDCVARLHHGRRADFRHGLWLGRGDRLISFKKPIARTRTIGERLWNALPEELTLRMIRVPFTAKGFRTRQLTLITTLLDPEKYPTQEIAALYRRRWEVELFFRDIKTMLQMEHLSCKTPAMVEKEFLMHMIAYNLIRCLMLEAARQNDVSLDRISFKGSVDAVRQYSVTIAQASNQKKRRHLVSELLQVMADDQVPFRPNRNEPRAVKRRPKPFPLLNQPRHRFKTHPHRNRSWPGKQYHRKSKA